MTLWYVSLYVLKCVLKGLYILLYASKYVLRHIRYMYVSTYMYVYVQYEHT